MDSKKEKSIWEDTTFISVSCIIFALLVLLLFLFIRSRLNLSNFIASLSYFLAPKSPYQLLLYLGVIFIAFIVIISFKKRK